jgi:hypothetical protein
MNRLTEAQTRKVHQTAGKGELPLEIMVERMRELWAGGEKDEAVAIAEKCAPYFHPRLAAIDHKGHMSVAVTQEDMISTLETVAASVTTTTAIDADEHGVPN